MAGRLIPIMVLHPGDMLLDSTVGTTELVLQVQGDTLWILGDGRVHRRNLMPVADRLYYGSAVLVSHRAAG
jgi:hypothetical protein